MNNAGIALGRPFGQISFADYERLIAVNVTGMFVATQDTPEEKRSESLP